MDNKSLEGWIKKDAVKQIQESFSSKWKKLQTEISICINERFTRSKKKIETTEYLLSQFKLCKELSETSKEASLLMLGRITEHVLRIKLDMYSRISFTELIMYAKTSDLIDSDERKMLDKIRDSYNRLKHSPFYGVESCPLNELIESFSHFIGTPDFK